MSDQKAPFAMGTAENFVQRAQQYVDAVSTMSQRGQQIAGAFNDSLGQVSAYIERLQAQFPSGDKAAQNAKGNNTNSVIARVLGQADTFVKGMSEKVDFASNMLGQADGFVKGISQKVGLASKVIDDVSSTAGEIKEFSSASVSAWQAITSSKSKTSAGYWNGVFSSVKNLYKEGKDVTMSVQTAVDTLTGKALDKDQEAQKSTVSTSPLSKDVSNRKAQKKRAKNSRGKKGSGKQGRAGGANNKGGSAAAKVQRVFVVNMPKSGAFAVQRDKTHNTSEPTWVDQAKSAVDIAKDLVELRNSMKERHQSDNQDDSSKESHAKGDKAATPSIVPKESHSNSAKVGVSGILPSRLSSLLSGMKLPKVFKAIKGNAAVSAVMNSEELAEVWTGDASVKDKVEKSGGIIGSVVGSGLGTWGGAAAGAAIGSVVPVIGTAVGGLIGGVVGSIGGGSLGESLGGELMKSVTSWFSSDDDTAKMKKKAAHTGADGALEKAQGEIKISVEDKRVTVSSVKAHNLNLAIAGSSMGGLS